MKIFAISTCLIPSDTANSIQVMKACQGLVQLGHKVTLLVPGKKTSNASQQALASHYGLATPFEVVHIPAASRRVFTLSAVRRAKHFGAELLYIWPAQSAVFGQIAGLPVILELHDLPTGNFGPLWFRFFLYGGGHKRLLLITTALRQALERELHINLGNQDVLIAPNGVDLERFANLPEAGKARSQIGLPDSHTVICTGHLYAGRGADLFLTLASDLRETNFFWVGGRSQDVTEWKNRAAAQGLDNVTFTGFVPNEILPLYQAAADILLMPYGRIIGISSGIGRSAEVSSPMKMFEYMAAGRTILTSDLPVLREVLDESTAVFCPPEDATAWSAAIKSLLGNPTRRISLGQHARQAVERYTWIERARRALAGFEGQE